MQPIISGQISQGNVPAAGKFNIKKADSPKAQVDTFTPTKEESIKSGESWLTKLLDMRVPTTTQSFPTQERDKVLDLIQPGDVILETNDAYPGWQVLEKTVFNSDYTHAAIYEGDGKFLEATTGDPSGKGVVRTDLKEYLEGRINLEIIRPPYKTPEDREAALNYARAQLGKPYDAAFNQKDDKEHYCAELVQRSLAAMPNPINVKLVDFMGRKAVGPNAFQNIPGAETVYSTNASFFKSAMSHLPVYAGAAAIATLAGLSLGAGFVAPALLVGGLFSTMVGNKIQAGQFTLFPE